MDFHAAIEVVLVSDAGERDVAVRVGKPLPFADGPGFYCPVQISGLGDEKVELISGPDPRQALQLAIDTVHARLKGLYPEILAKLRSNDGRHLGS